MGPQAGQRFHDAHAHGWLGHTHACSHASKPATIASRSRAASFFFSYAADFFAPAASAAAFSSARRFCFSPLTSWSVKEPCMSDSFDFVRVRSGAFLVTASGTRMPAAASI